MILRPHLKSALAVVDPHVELVEAYLAEAEYAGGRALFSNPFHADADSMARALRVDLPPPVGQAAVIAANRAGRVAVEA